MRMIEHIPELMAAGVDSLKIEGRAKSSYYAAAVKRLFGRTPDLVLIYSLALGDTVVILPENID